MSDHATTPAAEITSGAPTARRTADALRADTERFLSTVGRLRAELLDTRAALSREQALTAALHEQIRRLRAEVSALTIARDAALRIAAWGGPRHERRGYEVAP